MLLKKNIPKNSLKEPWKQKTITTTTKKRTGLAQTFKLYFRKSLCWRTLESSRVHGETLARFCLYILP